MAKSVGFSVLALLFALYVVFDVSEGYVDNQAPQCLELESFPVQYHPDAVCKERCQNASRVPCCPAMTRPRCVCCNQGSQCTSNTTAAVIVCNECQSPGANGMEPIPNCAD